VAVRVNPNFVSELPSQQAVDGNTESLAQDVPQCSFDTADRVVYDARYGTSSRSCQPQFTKQPVNVPWVFTEKEWLQRTQDRSKAGSKETFAEAGDALVGLNANERPIEISFHYRGFETGNFQWPARLFRTAIMEKSEHDVDSVLIAAYRQPNSVNCGVLNPPRITICMVLLNRLNPVDWSW